MSIPNGWKLVPVDPTEDMCHVANVKRFFFYCDECKDASANPTDVWKIMLSAAPTPPEVEPVKAALNEL